MLDEDSVSRYINIQLHSREHVQYKLAFNADECRESGWPWKPHLNHRQTNMKVHGEPHLSLSSAGDELSRSDFKLTQRLSVVIEINTAYKVISPFVPTGCPGDQTQIGLSAPPPTSPPRDRKQRCCKQEVIRIRGRLPLMSSGWVYLWSFIFDPAYVILLLNQRLSVCDRCVYVCCLPSAVCRWFTVKFPLVLNVL